MDYESVKTLLESHAGQELKKILLDEYSKLDTVKGIGDLPTGERIEVEARARELASEKVKAMLEKIVDFEKIQSRGSHNKDSFQTTYDKSRTNG